MKKQIIGLLVIAFFCRCIYADINLLESQLTYIDLGAGKTSIQITGIDGTRVAGWYSYQPDGSPYYSKRGGFIKELNTENVSYYKFGDSTDTMIYAFSGNLIAGYYQNAGQNYFIKDITSASNQPKQLPTAYLVPSAIYGNKIVGYGGPSGNSWYPYTGFIYENETLTFFSPPGATDTFVRGVYGNKIVGIYNDSVTRGLGFLYDSSNFQTLLHPDGYRVSPTAIYEDIIVGSLWDTINNSGHGFIYDGTNWTLVDVEGSASTYLTGISGNNITGIADGRNFIALNAIPESSSLSLLALGGFLVIFGRRRR
jgi:hypothetical protein